MLSDNADPLTMFRVNRVTPFKLPSFLGVLGPMRVEFFIGQYSGYEFMFTPSGLVGQYGAVPTPAADCSRGKIQLQADAQLRVRHVANDGLRWPGLSVDMAHVSSKRVFKNRNHSGCCR